MKSAESESPRPPPPPLYLRTVGPPENAALGSIIASAKVEEGFVSAFSEVAIAPSTDESRHVLTGVFMEGGDGAVRLTATDSYRLHHEAAGSGQGETRAVVTPRYLRSLAGNELILIEFGDDRVRFTDGAVTVTITASTESYM